jgi:hypothetical protein
LALNWLPVNYFPISNGSGEFLLWDSHSHSGWRRKATCGWNRVLSTPPGEMNPPRRDFSKDDPRVERITANLLKRMIQGSRRPRVPDTKPLLLWGTDGSHR